MDKKAMNSEKAQRMFALIGPVVNDAMKMMVEGIRVERSVQLPRYQMVKNGEKTRIKVVFNRIRGYKRNLQWSSVRGAVEHPFAYMKTKAGLSTMDAKNQARNGLRFVFNCIGWNLQRMLYLVHGTKSVGLVAL